MNPLAVVLDGEIVPHDRPAFAPLERALLYGDGLFETMAAAHGRVLELGAHRARLEASCTALGFATPPSWDDAIALCLRAAGPTAGVVRVTWTRGMAFTRGYAPRPEDGPPRLLVLAYPAPPSIAGVRAISLTAPALGELARHKTTSALGRIVALQRARARGAQEALLLDEDGCVLEASSSNVFAVIDGEVRTPPASRPILPGLSRVRTIAWTNAAERDLTVEDVRTASEVFITSSVVGAIPIVELDGTKLEAGPVARDVLARDRARHQS